MQIRILHSFLNKKEWDDSYSILKLSTVHDDISTRIGKYGSILIRILLRDTKKMILVLELESMAEF